jgi:hypothetical protein
LLEKGNGNHFAGSDDAGAETVEALLNIEGGWSFVVMCDYSQSACEAHSRAEALQSLERDYAPLLAKAGAVPVLMPQQAYRKHAKGSEKLGSWADFNRKQNAGYAEYQVSSCRKEG